MPSDLPTTPLASPNDPEGAESPPNKNEEAATEPTTPSPAVEEEIVDEGEKIQTGDIKKASPGEGTASE